MAEQGFQGFLLQGFIVLEYFYLFSYRRLYEVEITGKIFMYYLSPSWFRLRMVFLQILIQN